ncbi:unnamed protein product [Trifolium pratense]|uniref:Uncharacterized protein n=1 Tax=Trifolium pratense TaxID=57577 RepID=A0ACB0K787_TRIPR|nr:unnamed protein product [Trifolium pratense]
MLTIGVLLMISLSFLILVRQGVLPCSETLSCPRYSSCLHVNCGGNNIQVRENGKTILYIGLEMEM